MRSRSRRVASIGPVSISTGSTPTRHWSTTRARGRSPSSRARAAVVSKHRGRAVGDLRRRCPRCARRPRGRRASASPALRATSRAVLRRARRDGSCRSACLPRRRRARRSAATSRSNRPSAQARCARCCDSSPNCVGVGAGDAPLVGDALGAFELRRELVVVAVRRGASAGRSRRAPPRRAGRGSSTRRRTTSATSTTPAATSAAARLVACCDDPHWLSTVVAATSSGSPALSQARPRDVERLLADLAHAAADDLADLQRVDAGAVDRPPAAPRRAGRRDAPWRARRCGDRAALGPLRR